MPKEEQSKWVRLSLLPKSRLHIFGRYFFPHIIKGAYETPDIHLDLIDFLSSPEWGAGIIPRGFAKSTWEKIDTIHDIVYSLEPVILYISDALQSAQFHFESMKIELETNDALRLVYGNLVPDLKDQQSVKWTNSHFETTNGVNVVARGAGKGRGVNIRNQRPTKVIIDDGETDEMVRSHDRREKYWRWITDVIIPSIDKERGRLKVIGTVINPHAAVKRFYDERGGIFRRAIEDGKSVWPEMWSIEDLLRLRDGYTDDKGDFHPGIGIRAFSQEYMNEPINEDTSIFKQEWLDRNQYTNIPTNEELSRFYDVKMAVDPNAGQSEMADFMGICVIGRHRGTKKRYVLECRRVKKPINGQEEEFERTYSRWNPVIAGVECVLNQTALYQMLSSRRKYRLKKLSPEGKDKVNRAHHVEPLVEQDIIQFHPNHKDLYNELIDFPNGLHDDLVDAFVYCNSLFEENAVKLTTERHDTITGGLINAKF